MLWKKDILEERGRKNRDVHRSHKFSGRIDKTLFNSGD